MGDVVLMRDHAPQAARERGEVPPGGASIVILPMLRIERAVDQILDSVDAMIAGARERPFE